MAAICVKNSHEPISSPHQEDVQNKKLSQTKLSLDVGLLRLKALGSTDPSGQQKHVKKRRNPHTCRAPLKRRAAPRKKQETDENCLTAEHHQGRIVATIKETCKLSRPFPIISIKVSFNYVYNM